MTPSYHIIRETSDSVSGLLQRELERAGHPRVQVVDHAPRAEAIEGRLPALSVYLAQVSLDSEGVDANVSGELVRVVDAGGAVREFQRRRRLWVRLDYLISAWARSPEDEQLLLGLAIRVVMEYPSLRGEALLGASFEPDFELNLVLSTRLDDGALGRFWSSLHQPQRPAIQAWTAVPIIPEQLQPFHRVAERRIDVGDRTTPLPRRT